MGGLIVGVAGAALLAGIGLVLWRRADAGGKQNGPGQSRLASVIAFVGAVGVVILAIRSAVA